MVRVTVQKCMALQANFDAYLTDLAEILKKIHAEHR